MRIFVKAKPSARQEKVEKIDETHFAVWVKEPPKEGKANKAISRVLSDYFAVPASMVNLVSGYASRQKVFEIRIKD